MVTFKGNPLTLVGQEVQVGASAPVFEVTANDLKSVSLKDFLGKTLVISTVPSVDTETCNLQSRRFSEEAAKRSNVQFITISEDLPFAQARWAKEASCSLMPLYSDYKERSFARAWGLLIDELKLLTRAVFIVDKSGKIVYKEIVSEVTEQPHYDKLLAALDAL